MLIRLRRYAVGRIRPTPGGRPLSLPVAAGGEPITVGDGSIVVECGSIVGGGEPIRGRNLSIGTWYRRLRILHLGILHIGALGLVRPVLIIKLPTEAVALIFVRRTVAAVCIFLRNPFVWDWHGEILIFDFLILVSHVFVLFEFRYLCGGAASGRCDVVFAQSTARFGLARCLRLTCGRKQEFRPTSLRRLIPLEGRRSALAPRRCN